MPAPFRTLECGDPAPLWVLECVTGAPSGGTHLWVRVTVICFPPRKCTRGIAEYRSSQTVRLTAPSQGKDFCGRELLERLCEVGKEGSGIRGQESFLTADHGPCFL